MKKRRLYAVATITVLIVAVAILVTFNYVSHQQKDSLSTNSFFQEPIVDVILPTLVSNNANAPLNLTRGSNASLPVQVFPTMNLTAVISVSIISLSSPNENVSNMIATSINPPILTIAPQSSGNSTLGINTTPVAQVGEYGVTVTVTNLGNESQYWGTFFQLNILP